MTFDRATYEREQQEKLKATSEKLRPLIEFDEWGLGPVIELTCPRRDHSLKRYRAQDGGSTITLEALPGESSKGGPVASNGSVWNRTKSVCEVPGCPTLVIDEGKCEDHGGRASEVVHHVRTKFVCRRCAWEDNFTTSRLLQVYGIAVHLGLSSIPITGTPRRR